MSLEEPWRPQVVNPVITCALVANGCVWAYAAATGQAFKAVLKSYLTKNAAAPGAGDYLMGVLGVVILSFGFRIFEQRRLMKRHVRARQSALIPKGMGSSMLLVAEALGDLTCTFARATTSWGCWAWSSLCCSASASSNSAR
jgi:hypothetical protein